MGEMQRTTRPRARKSHTCDDCGCRIDPGTVYERVSGKWEGAFRTSAYCVECADLSCDLYHLPGGLYYGEGPDGEECYPYLNEFDDWAAARAISPEWAARVDAYFDRLSSRLQATRRPT